MTWLIIKCLLTSAIGVVISEFARRSDRLGSLIAALPLVTLLALVWLRLENQSAEKNANHAWYTFWYVVPTLPMFLAFQSLQALRILVGDLRLDAGYYRGLWLIRRAGKKIWYRLDVIGQTRPERTCASSPRATIKMWF